MAANRLRISLEIPASCPEVWAKIADWPSQGDWMLQTKVWLTSEKREGVGTSITALQDLSTKSIRSSKILDC